MELKEKLFNILPKALKKTLVRTRLIHLYDDAVEKAEKAHKESGKRIYIVAGPNGNLMVMTRDGFKTAKRKRVISDRLTMSDLKALSIYYTAGQFEREPMEPGEREARREDFILWWLESAELA